MSKTKYILNPIYNIKSDERRSLIINTADESISPLVTHPIFAALFSFFDGKNTYERVLNNVCMFFGTNHEETDALIKGFIDNEKDFMVKYDNEIFRFVPHILIENKHGIVRNDLDPEAILISPPYDFTNRRLYLPLDVLFIINTKCVTDCVYCYADKHTKYIPMPTERILSIIDDAHNIGVRRFELSGGEVFTHKDWKTIVKKLVENGYCDFISTKVPMTNKQVDDLAETGMKTLQISLDSLNPTLQTANLNVSESYCSKMQESLKYIDSKNIEIIIKATLTRHTCTVDNIRQIIDFISNLKHLKKFTVSTIGASLYKTNESFHNLKPTQEELKTVYGYLDSINDKMTIQPDNQETLHNEMCNFSKFKNRTMCTGNVSGLVILPDGKVTICEELYWNEDFLIGDLMKNNILDIWQSEKAIGLWNIEQKIFPKESACSSCQDFNKCHKGLGVCWKYIISVYGKKNFLYPDPRCPKAPQMIYDIFYD